MSATGDEAHAPEPAPGARRAPPVEVVDPVTGEVTLMTKSAAKKLAKRALRDQKKEATKHERRARERERRKEKRRLAREARALDATPRVREPRPRPQPFGARVVVDLGFDDLMTADEATSLAAQLGYLYGENRRSSHPFFEVVMSGAGRLSGRALGFEPPHGAAHQFPAPGTAESSLFQDRVGEHMERKNEGTWRRWQRVRLLEYGGLEALWTPGTQGDALCAKSDVVYLTADTDETIEALEPGMTYVIGGIVDRNRYKHLCARKAEALGLRMARLPIEPAHLQGYQMHSRKVLTVNQVFAILTGWTETRDWTQALLRGLPTRKLEGGTAGGGGSGGGSGDGGDGGASRPESAPGVPSASTPPPGEAAEEISDAAAEERVPADG